MQKLIIIFYLLPLSILISCWGQGGEINEKLSNNYILFCYGGNHVTISPENGYNNDNEIISECVTSYFDNGKYIFAIQNPLITYPGNWEVPNFKMENYYIIDSQKKIIEKTNAPNKNDFINIISNKISKKREAIKFIEIRTINCIEDNLKYHSKFNPEVIEFHKKLYSEK